MMLALGIFIIFQFVFPTHQQCLDLGWVGRINYGYSDINDTWYDVSWNTAEGPYYAFASVPDAFTNRYLILNISSQNCPSDGRVWLGGAVDYFGKWSWTDGSNFNYHNWAPGDPKYTKKGYCLAMDVVSGKWYAENCSNPHYGINENLNNGAYSYGQKCPRAGCTSGYLNIMNVCEMTPEDDDNHYYMTYGEVDKKICGEFFANEYNLTNLHLISIHDEIDNNLVQIYGTTWIDGGQMVLGIHDPYNNGTFEWYDGTPVDYTNWASPPPPGSCAYMLGDGSPPVWYPIACDQAFLPATMNYLCVMPGGNYPNDDKSSKLDRVQRKKNKKIKKAIN